MSLFFYLFTFAINLWHEILMKKSFCLKGYTANRLTDEFSEKSRAMHDVNKLLKNLRDTGAADRRPCRTRSVRTEENVETVNGLLLRQEDNPQTHRPIYEISREKGIHQCTQNLICLHFLPYLLNICRPFEFVTSQGSVATCLR